ncbi:MAG TPA: DUF2292 domain-containing protein [Deltaproteobacteria bacterium]|nr:DUF2292 domain-containing protein [Deltaproteobacteria bacterium]
MDDLGNLKFEDILKFIKGVDYGEVVFTIHDSQIVQVEKREKKRFRPQKRLQEQS